MPLWQIAPGPQHFPPHSVPLQQTLLPPGPVRHFSFGPQHVLPQSVLPLQQNSLPALSFMHLPLQHCPPQYDCPFEQQSSPTLDAQYWLELQHSVPQHCEPFAQHVSYHTPPDCATVLQP